jgi:hypothetical protein
VDKVTPFRAALSRNIMNSDRIKFLKMMADRLERLNVDSKWARRASGTRGGVIHMLEHIQQGKMPSEDEIDHLINKSLDILTRAARDIPDTKMPKER